MKHAKHVRNWMKLDSLLQNRCKYMFVDSPEHRADRILIGALIPAAFERPAPSASDEAGGFEVRVCYFDSKYEAWFLNCMADLAWVLEGDDENGGHPGAYAKACSQLLAAA